MAPEDRRASLVQATLPLLRQYGRDVSTRQIAEAAGVAEGTIFRVFPNKETLIDAALEAAFDPAPLFAGLSGIDTELPLRERLVAIVDQMQQRMRGVITLMLALRMNRPPNKQQFDPTGKPHQRAVDQNLRIVTAIAAVLDKDADRLRMPPMQVADVVRLLTFSASHPLISDGRMLTAEQIADIVLDGVRTPDDIRSSMDPSKDSNAAPTTA
jgi:AcrR family transcriptional regulator